MFPISFIKKQCPQRIYRTVNDVIVCVALFVYSYNLLVHVSVKKKLQSGYNTSITSNNRMATTIHQIDLNEPRNRQMVKGERPQQYKVYVASSV